MSLHNGLDTVSIASLGLYTKTYGSSNQVNINSLFASLGLLETAPAQAEVIMNFVSLIPRNLIGLPSRSLSGFTVLGPILDVIY